VKGPLMTAAGFACAIGCALYFRTIPFEISELGLKKLRRSLFFAVFSLLLLSVICEINFFGGNWDYGPHRGILFLLIVADLVVNGIAVFSFLGPLIGLLPFSKRDASDVTPLGMMFVLGLSLIEAFLCLLAFSVMWGAP